jgi:hypothetical protein
VLASHGQEFQNQEPRPGQPVTSFPQSAGQVGHKENVIANDLQEQPSAGRSEPPPQSKNPGRETDGCV